MTKNAKDNRYYNGTRKGQSGRKKNVILAEDVLPIINDRVTNN